jgi:hypothetical protein
MISKKKYPSSLEYLDYMNTILSGRDMAFGNLPLPNTIPVSVECPSSAFASGNPLEGGNPKQLLSG